MKGNKYQVRFDLQNLKTRFLGQTLFNKYKVTQYIDKGHFGVIFKAKILSDYQILQNKKLQDKNKFQDKKKSLYEQILNDSEDSVISLGGSSHFNQLNPQYVAVKIEDFVYLNNGQNYKHSHLFQEVKITEKLQGKPGFPKLYDYSFNETEGIMIIEFMQTNLQNLFNLTEYISNSQSKYQHHMVNNNSDDKEFSIQTVVMIGMQMIDRLESFHEIGYLHKDIKPDNLMIGQGLNQSTIYLLDYGISKSYLTKDKKHIPYSTKIKFAGTQKFSSIAADQGIEQGRKDDLEALGYVLVYFSKGSLPWCGIRDADNAKVPIKDIKKNTDIQELCEDMNYEFWKYFKYLKSLKFEDKPNYQYLRNLFREMIQNDKLYHNFCFDWQIEDSALRTLMTHQTVVTSNFRAKSADEEIEQEDEKEIQNFFQKQISAGMKSRKQSNNLSQFGQKSQEQQQIDQKYFGEGEFINFKQINDIQEEGIEENLNFTGTSNEEIPSEDPYIFNNFQQKIIINNFNQHKINKFQRSLSLQATVN